MLVYGFHAIDALLQKNNSIISIHVLWKAHSISQRKTKVIHLAKAKGIACYEYKNNSDYERAWEAETKEKSAYSQGIFAIIKTPDKVSAEQVLHTAAKKKNGIVLFLDSITDEQNLGSILRTAAFFAVDGLIWANRRSAPMSPRVLKISSGAFVHVPVASVTNLTRTLKIAKDNNFWIYGLSEHSKKELTQNSFQEPSIFILGSEEKGIRPLVKQHCDEILSLPALGSQSSLNAAIACAISLTLIRKQQKEGFF